MNNWLEDIRIEGRIYASAATLGAWVGTNSMHMDWFGNPPHKVMVF